MEHNTTIAIVAICFGTVSVVGFGCIAIVALCLTDKFDPLLNFIERLPVVGVGKFLRRVFKLLS